jgi:hypothetical protein
MLFKIELFDEVEKELFECRTENERLLAIISDQEKALEESAQTVEQLRTEKEAAKRQLEDLQSTLEFQEAKMDQVSTLMRLFFRTKNFGQIFFSPVRMDERSPETTEKTLPYNHIIKIILFNNVKYVVIENYVYKIPFLIVDLKLLPKLTHKIFAPQTNAPGGLFFGSRSSSVGGERRRRSLRRKKEQKPEVGAPAAAVTAKVSLPYISGLPDGLFSNQKSQFG